MPNIEVPTTDLLDSKRAARVATTANITLSGTQTIDDVPLVVDDRVLVKDQSTGSENGVRLVAVGPWPRAEDASDNTQVDDGIFIWVREGTANGASAWFLETIAPIDLGVTALVFDQFAKSGGTAAHAPQHENGGSDEINVAGLSGELADPQVPKSHVHDAADVTTGTFVDARISSSSVTQHVALIDHDLLLNFDIAEHRIINDAGTSTIEMWSASKIDSVTKAISAGIDLKDPVETGTLPGDGNITLSGEQTIRGVATSSTRVCLSDQTSGAENGAWVTAAGAWSRPSDFDSDAEVTNGARFFVDNPSSTAYRYEFFLTTSNPISIDVDPLTFVALQPLDFGTTAGTAAEGNDSRIPTQDENDALLGTNGTPSGANRFVTASDPTNTNARTPIAHAASHQHGGSDEIATATSSANAIPKANVSGDLADEWISETSVTQHEAALTITESQILDLHSPGKVIQTKTVELGTDETVGVGAFSTLFSTTITVAAGSDLVVVVTTSISNSAANKNIMIRLIIDGTTKGGAQEEQKTANLSASLVVAGRKDGLTAGSKTVALEWETSGGTAQCEPLTRPDSEHATIHMYEVTG